MNKKSLSDTFCTIDPAMLDDWFNYMINNYCANNSPMQQALITTYQVMLGNTVVNKSLEEFYDENGYGY